MSSTKAKFATNTSIYRDTQKIMNHLLDEIPNIPRAYRNCIGDRMIGICVDLLDLVALAYTSQDPKVRFERLSEFQGKFETLRTLVRTAGERKLFKGKSRFANLVEIMVGIGKQSSAWKNSVVMQLNTSSLPQGQDFAGVVP